MTAAKITMTRGKDEILASATQVRVLENEGWKTKGEKTALKEAGQQVDGTSDTPIATPLEVAAAKATPADTTPHTVGPPS